MSAYNTDVLDLIDSAVLDKTVDDLNDEVTELAASMGEVLNA